MGPLATVLFANASRIHVDYFDSTINGVGDDDDDEIGNDDTTLALSGAGANDGRLVEPKVPCHRAENCHPPTPNPQPTSPPKLSSLLRHNYSATGVLTGCVLGS